MKSIYIFKNSDYIFCNPKLNKKYIRSISYQNIGYLTFKLYVHLTLSLLIENNQLLIKSHDNAITKATQHCVYTIERLQHKKKNTKNLKHMLYTLINHI